MTDQNTPKGGRPSAPDAVWEAVRTDYLAGASGIECARKHGVGVTALRSRAAAQGWRRKDQVWSSPPNRLDAEDEGVVLEDQIEGDLDRLDYAELAMVADRRMMRAVLRGDAMNALRWRRVRMAMDEEQAEVERWVTQNDSIVFQNRARGEQTDNPDNPDSVFSEPGSG